MKTTIQFFKLKQPLCTGDYSFLRRFWHPRLSTQQITKDQSNKEKQTSKSLRPLNRLMTMMESAPAVLVAVVGNSKSIAKAFPRLIVGLVILVWVAPYADVFYTRLDFNDRVSPDVWYYESYYWLFLCLGPYLKGVLQMVGLYFIFVQKSHIKAYVLAYPLMYDLGKILWLLQVDNHAEYNSVTPNMFLLYGFTSAVFLIGALNLLSFWLFHRVHAVKARLQGLRNIADKADSQIIVKSFCETMDADVKVSQFKY